MLYKFYLSYPRILKVLNSVEMKTGFNNATLNYDWTHVGKILTSDKCGQKHAFLCCIKLNSFTDFCTPLKVTDLSCKESLHNINMWRGYNSFYLIYS